MLPWEVFIFGSSELAGNESKTSMRYTICSLYSLQMSQCSKAEAIMA